MVRTYIGVRRYMVRTYMVRRYTLRRYTVCGGTWCGRTWGGRAWGGGAGAGGARVMVKANEKNARIITWQPPCGSGRMVTEGVAQAPPGHTIKGTAASAVQRQVAQAVLLGAGLRARRP